MQEAVIAKIKFKDITSVLCKTFVSLKLQGSLYKSCVRNALCYFAECWALKKEDERKLQTAKRRMLRMICGKTLGDSISNETIGDMTQVENIEELLKE